MRQIIRNALDLKRALAIGEHDFDDEPESPYCECDLQYDEEEQAFNKCSCCGKPIA